MSELTEWLKDEASDLEEEGRRLYSQALNCFERAKRIRTEQGRRMQAIIDAALKDGAA